MTTPVIPCKQPKVSVVTNKDLSTTYCLVPGCDWKYGPGVKTHVEQQATRHRAEHRGAVPKIEVIQLVSLVSADREADQCQHCGWVTTGSTKTDRAAQVTCHLTAHHGLVSC